MNRNENARPGATNTKAGQPVMHLERMNTGHYYAECYPHRVILCSGALRGAHDAHR